MSAQPAARLIPNVMKRHDGHGSGYNVGSHRDPSRAWAGTGAAAGTSEFAGMSAFGTKRTSRTMRLRVRRHMVVLNVRFTPKSGDIAEHLSVKVSSRHQSLLARLLLGENGSQSVTLI